MKTNLVPIKVKIGIGTDGKEEYPQFNNLNSDVRASMDWSNYIDAHGTGWHYSEEGHGEGADPDNWYGCTLVPKPFADAAVSKFPDQVQIISESDFEDFYDNDSMSKQETEILDTTVLQGIAARVQLEESSAPTVEPSAEILELRRKALDPNEPNRGIRKNPRRKWKDFKKFSSLQLDPSVPK